MLKPCSNCKKIKDISNFCVNRRTEDGLNPVCRGCNAEYKKKYYAKNRDKITDEKREYRKYNKEQREDYLLENKEKIRQQQKDYYKKNKEQIKGQRKTHEAKTARVNADSKRRAIKLSSHDGKVPNDSRDYPNSKALMELQTAQNDKCYLCKSILDYNTPFAVHLDHIIPLSKGGQHSLDNVAWCCKTCNLTKGAQA